MSNLIATTENLNERQRFFDLALARYNQTLTDNSLEPVDETDFGFRCYLTAILLGIAKTDELASWSKYFERELAK